MHNIGLINMKIFDVGPPLLKVTPCRAISGGPFSSVEHSPLKIIFIAGFYVRIISLLELG